MDSKYAEKDYKMILGIGIPDFLMNLFQCHGLSNNIKYIVILKCPKSLLEYYFSKGFGILKQNSNILTKIPNLVKTIIHVEETKNSDYVMTSINTITSISNTPKKLLFYKFLHYYYIKTEFNDKERITYNTFSTYFEPFLNEINHPVLVQEWKLNLDAVAYEKKIDSDVYKPSSKKEIYFHDSNQ